MATKKLKGTSMKPRTSAIDTRPAAKKASVVAKTAPKRPMPLPKPKPKAKVTPKPKATTKKTGNSYMDSITEWQKAQDAALTNMWNKDKKSKTGRISTK